MIFSFYIDGVLAIPHKLATYVNVHVFCIVWDILFHNITDCERTAKIISVCVKDTKNCQ